MDSIKVKMAFRLFNCKSDINSGIKGRSNFAVFRFFKRIQFSFICHVKIRQTDKCPKDKQKKRGDVLKSPRFCTDEPVNRIFCASVVCQTILTAVMFAPVRFTLSPDVL